MALLHLPSRICRCGDLTNVILSHSGRCANMVVMAHSSAALFGAPLTARKAGALILLGCYFFPSPDYHASLHEWSRCSIPLSLLPYSPRWMDCVLRL